MCGAPKMPKPLPPRQAPQAPDAGTVARRSTESLSRRFGFAASVMTPGSLAPAMTTGKTLLGS